MFGELVVQLAVQFVDHRGDHFVCRITLEFVFLIFFLKQVYFNKMNGKNVTFKTFNAKASLSRVTHRIG